MCLKVFNDNVMEIYENYFVNINYDIYGSDIIIKYCILLVEM